MLEGKMNAHPYSLIDSAFFLTSITAPVSLLSHSMPTLPSLLSPYNLDCVNKLESLAESRSLETDGRLHLPAAIYLTIARNLLTNQPSLCPCGKGVCV